MILLLTGFKPFGTSRVNPSEQVTRALAREKINGVEIHTAILPVDSVRGPEMLISAFEHHKPDAVLCLGQSSRRSAISIERVAINLLDYRIADNAGIQVSDEPIVRGAPAAYFTTLPVRAMLNAMRAACVPAELSLSAGAFLCNQVTFSLLHYLAQKNLTNPTGFIHLPELPEQAASRDPIIPSMSLDTMLIGIRAAIGAIHADLMPKKQCANRIDLSKEKE